VKSPERQKLHYNAVFWATKKIRILNAETQKRREKIRECGKRRERKDSRSENASYTTPVLAQVEKAFR
jgi:hypothetical protein